jgi:formylmethanofuran dehydrogenase subunit A
MNIFKIAGVILIIAGVLGLVYGKFSYTKETKETKMGPIELTVKEEEMFEIPYIVGAGTVIFGSLILLFGMKRD